MMDTIQSGILRILHPIKGTTLGTAFVVSNTLIATCAHVLENAGFAPGDTVSLVFYHLNRSAQADIEPEHWHDQAQNDIALLRLHGPLPPGVRPLPLITSHDSISHHFRTFGFPDVKPVEGLVGTGTIDGRTTDRGVLVFQMTSEQITHGFSGAPLWDVELHGVVGIVNSIIGTLPHRVKDASGHAYTATSPVDPARRNQRTSFATTIETLFQLCPELPLSEPSQPLLPTNTDACAPLPSQYALQDIKHASNSALSNTGNASSYEIRGNQYNNTYINMPQNLEKDWPQQLVDQTSIAQFSILLQQLQIPKSDLQDAYNECVPEDLIGANIWLLPNINDITQLLHRIFTQLEEVPEAENGIPAILAFVEFLSLLPDVNRKDPSRKLRGWADAYIETHKIELEKVDVFRKQHKANRIIPFHTSKKVFIKNECNTQSMRPHISSFPSSPLSLLVKLRREPGTKKFFVQAWLRENKTAQLHPFPLPPEKDTSLFDISYPLSRIPALLERFLFNIAKYAISIDMEAQKVNIEFFVPCELFDEDFDTWKFDDRLPVGMHYQLYIRAAERKIIQHDLWKEKCQKLHAVIQSSCDRHLHWIDNVQGYDTDVDVKFAANLVSKDIVGLAMSICPSHFTPVKVKRMLFSALVLSGVPVAFWPRRLPTDWPGRHEAQSILSSFLGERKLVELPDNIQEQRINAYKIDKNHIGNHLTLFLDEWETRLPFMKEFLQEITTRS